MGLDKKIYAVLFLLAAFILVSPIYFVLPGVSENHRLSVQKLLANEVAGRFDLYLHAAAAELSEAASSPALQNWESGGKPPDLSKIKKNKLYFFNDFFLFNSGGEIIKSQANDSLPAKAALPGRSDYNSGIPPAGVLYWPDGTKSVALLAPVYNVRGQQTGWLAGTVNTAAVRSGRNSSSADDGVFLLCFYDGETLFSLRESGAGISVADIQRAVGGRIAAGNITTEKYTIVSAAVNLPGWSVVAAGQRAGTEYFAGKNLKASLPVFLLSLLLVMLSALYIKNLLGPVLKILSKLGHVIAGDSRTGIGPLARGLDSLIGHINVLENVPIGLMVVDRAGTIKFFNREAWEITGLEPFSVLDRPLKDFFPNNYNNYLMESMACQKEFLGLRNIIMVGDFFKELLMNISPLYSGGMVTGAVATFQDVTPQRKLIEVKAAYTLARDLALQKDLDSTVEVIAKAAADMVEVEYSAVFIADQEGSLTIRSAYGIPEKAVLKYNSSPYKTDGPEVSELYRGRGPLLHGDVRNKHNLRPMLIVPDVMSFYSYPIYYGEQLIGLVNLYSKEKDKLSRDGIYLIRSLSGQISAAISNFYEFQKMRALASMDGLTGLYNKKYFLDNIENEIVKSASSSSPLSLAMVDIDFFKTVNDTYGHQVGDQVLVEVSAALRQSLRETDIVCRYGGEEFSIIMPGTHKDKAIDVMERVRIRIEGTAIARNDQDNIFITVSCGIACYPADAGDAGTLISRSDTALYAAKRTGRNKVVRYNEDQTIG